MVSFYGNSDLVSNVRKKFKNDIAQNCYRGVDSLLVPENSGKNLFWQNNVRSSFSSVRESEGCCAENGTRMTGGVHRYFQSLRFAKEKRQNRGQLIERHGMSVVLKCDIKEDDAGCINALFSLPETELPQLVTFAGAAQLKYLIRLDAMGYSKFRVENHAVLDATMPMTALPLEKNDVPRGDTFLTNSRMQMRKQYPLSAEFDGMKIPDSGYDLYSSF